MNVYYIILVLCYHDGICVSDTVQYLRQLMEKLCDEHPLYHLFLRWLSVYLKGKTFWCNNIIYVNEMKYTFFCCYFQGKVLTTTGAGFNNKFHLFFLFMCFFYRHR